MNNSGYRQSSPLPPIQATKVAEQSQPRVTTKDLTSTLINSNLQQMNKSFSMEGMQQMRPTVNNIQPVANYGFNGNQPAYPRMPSSVSIPNSMQSAAAVQPPFSNPMQSVMSPGPMQMTPFQNPSYPQPQRPTGGMSSLSSFQSADSGVKKLSQKDIDDFLS